MIIENPKDVRARYAGRLAHQHHAVREAWRASKSPELVTVMAGLAEAREDHQTHTGWIASYDGETTTYHYTNPTSRERIGGTHAQE